MCNGSIIDTFGLLLLFAFLFVPCCGMCVSGEDSRLRITVVYNNVPGDTTLQTDWGFACYIEGTALKILFDTGGNGSVLLENMEKLGIAPESIDVLVLSHIHGDHTGGVETLLRANQHLLMYVPASFPSQFVSQAESLSSGVVRVRAPKEICEGVRLTGEMGVATKEQGLAVRSKKGVVLITGCAHPGIVNMVTRTKELFEEDVYLAMGGFHLLKMSEQETMRTIEELKRLGVTKVAPSHCTGDKQIKAFQDVYGDDFMAGGCGSVIEVR